MKSQTHKLFSQLCEGILCEATTLSSILPGSASANKLISYLHRNKSLPHDQPYQPTDNISWSVINDTRSGAWVIIKFANGVGAIKAGARKGGYDVIAVPDETMEVEVDSYTKGGDALNFFKELKLGRVQQLFVGRQGEDYEKKKTQRRTRQVDTSGTTDATQLVKKFQPLWSKAIEAAMADVKGMAVTMIQNDSIGKAQKKLERLSELQSLQNAMESGDLTGTSGDYVGRSKLEYLKNRVYSAILLTAANFYPEETGTLSKSYGGSISSERFSGPQQVLKDIAAGDQKKLGMVLGFFKRQLISG